MSKIIDTIITSRFFIFLKTKLILRPAWVLCFLPLIITFSFLLFILDGDIESFKTIVSSLSVEQAPPLFTEKSTLSTIFKRLLGFCINLGSFLLIFLLFSIREINGAFNIPIIKYLGKFFKTSNSVMLSLLFMRLIKILTTISSHASVAISNGSDVIYNGYPFMIVRKFTPADYKTFFENLFKDKVPSESFDQLAEWVEKEEIYTSVKNIPELINKLQGYNGPDSDLVQSLLSANIAESSSSFISTWAPPIFNGVGFTADLISGIAICGSFAVGASLCYGAYKLLHRAPKNTSDVLAPGMDLQNLKSLSGPSANPSGTPYVVRHDDGEATLVTHSGWEHTKIDCYPYDPKRTDLINNVIFSDLKTIAEHPVIPTREIGVNSALETALLLSKKPIGGPKFDPKATRASFRASTDDTTGEKTVVSPAGWEYTIGLDPETPQIESRPPKTWIKEEVETPTLQYAYPPLDSTVNINFRAKPDNAHLKGVHSSTYFSTDSEGARVIVTPSGAVHAVNEQPFSDPTAPTPGVTFGPQLPSSSILYDPEKLSPTSHIHEVPKMYYPTNSLKLNVDNILENLQYIQSKLISIEKRLSNSLGATKASKFYTYKDDKDIWDSLTLKSPAPAWVDGYNSGSLLVVRTISLFMEEMPFIIPEEDKAKLLRLWYGVADDLQVDYKDYEDSIVNKDYSTNSFLEIDRERAAATAATPLLDTHQKDHYNRGYYEKIPARGKQLRLVGNL